MSRAQIPFRGIYERPRSAEQIADATALEPSAVEMAALAAACLIDFVLLASDANVIINFLSPTILLAVMGWANWKMVARSSAAIWTPLFSFRLGTLVFLGIGALVPSFISEEALDYVLSLYPYAPSEAAKANTIWMVATTMALAGIAACSRVLPRIRGHSDGPTSSNTLAIGALFYAIGFGFTLLYELPSNLGLIQTVIPGFVLLGFQAANAVGLFLIALWAFRRGGGAVVWVFVLLTLNILVAVVALIKSMALFPELFVSLAYLMRGLTLRRAAVVTIGLTLTLFVLQPMVSYGRTVQYQQYLTAVGGTIGDRLSYAAEFLSGTRMQTSSSTADSSLTRLSYLNAATFVVHRYDSGQPDETIANALISIIPRVIWPEKPYTSAGASELYYLLTGSEGSAVGTTVAADIYWNLGWGGVFILPFLIGIGLWLATVAAYSIVLEQRWIMMPFVMVVFRIGLSIDNSFVTSIFAPGVMAIIIYGGLTVANKVFNTSTRSHTADASERHRTWHPGNLT